MLLRNYTLTHLVKSYTGLGQPSQRYSKVIFIKQPRPYLLIFTFTPATRQLKTVCGVIWNSHNSFNFRFCPKQKIHFSGDELFEKVWAIVFAMSGMSETSTLFTFQCRVQITELVYKWTIDFLQNFLSVIIPHGTAHFVVIHRGLLPLHAPLSCHLVSQIINNITVIIIIRHLDFTINGSKHFKNNYKTHGLNR